MPLRRKSLKLLLLLLSLVLVAVTPTCAFGQARPAATTPQFKVLAFYSGTFDAAHIPNLGFDVTQSFRLVQQP